MQQFFRKDTKPGSSLE